MPFKTDQQMLSLTVENSKAHPNGHCSHSSIVSDESFHDCFVVLLTQSLGPLENRDHVFHYK